MVPIRAIVVALAASLSAYGQALELRIIDKVKVPISSAPLMTGPFACDSSGGILYRQLTYSRKQVHLPSEVVRVSPDGQKVTRFDLRGAPGLTGPRLMTYALDPDDRLYMLVSPREPGGQFSIVRFDNDGAYRSATSIDAPGFRPIAFAVFASGDFLITGWQEDGKGKLPKPYTGVWSSRGQFLARVRVPLSNKAESRSVLVDAVELSMAETAQDGYIYLALPGSRTTVHAISPAGQVSRTFTAIPPDQKAMLTGLKVGGGRLALAFEEPPPKGGTAKLTIQILDTLTGEPMRTVFHQSYEIGTALACYVPDVFTFISSESGQMQMVHAAAR